MPISEECEKPFRDAARIPGDQNVDSFFRSASYQCASMNEYATALKKYPAALGLTVTPTNFDVQVSIQIACDYFDSQREAAVCIEGVEAGFVPPIG